MKLTEEQTNIIAAYVGVAQSHLMDVTMVEHIEQAKFSLDEAINRMLICQRELANFYYDE